MSSSTRLISSKLKVGETLNVVGLVSLPNTSNKFIKTGGVYNQADYPELFALLGLIDPSRGYSTTTEFFVPNYFTKTAVLAGEVKIYRYIKAKE